MRYVMFLCLLLYACYCAYGFYTDVRWPYRP